MEEAGALAKDTLKAARLLSAPVQLMAAYQDRFESFCERVARRVPENHQKKAASNIAKPVLEAFAFTDEESPLMEMFEELMAKAIDSREADKINPAFPKIISELTPYQAKLISDLMRSSHITEELLNAEVNVITRFLGSNFDFEKYGGQEHHLTIVQDLASKKIVQARSYNKIDHFEEKYPDLVVPDGFKIRTTTTDLTMFGKWFANSCVKTH